MHLKKQLVGCKFYWQADAYNCTLEFTHGKIEWTWTSNSKCYRPNRKVSGQRILWMLLQAIYLNML